jgi:hypothetical protein
MRRGPVPVSRDLVSQDGETPRSLATLTGCNRTSSSFDFELGLIGHLALSSYRWTRDAYNASAKRASFIAKIKKPQNPNEKREASKSSRVTVLPIGYVGILDGARMLQPAMYAGTPDPPAVSTLRQKHINVEDRQALHRAVDALWKAVDAGALRPMAIGGRPRRIVQLDPALTKAIPTLRSPRGRGFTSLRQSNPVYHELASWFGPDLSRVVLAFRESEVRRLGGKLVRARRTAFRSNDRKKARGRPSRQQMILPIVREVIESRKWSPLSSIKALTTLVNRKGEWQVSVSEETVTRVLDRLYDETRDRAFQRIRKIRKGSTPKWATSGGLINK